MSENSFNSQPTSLTTPPARFAVQLLICCAIGLTCFLGVYMRIPVLPLFAAELGAGAAQIGLINAAFMLTAGLLAIPSGLLSDKIGHRFVLLIGLMLMAVSSLLIPWCTEPLMLGMVYMLFGIGLSAFTPTMMSMVAKITPRSHLGRAYSWYTTAVYISMTLGPAAGGVLAGMWGMKPVFLVSGGLIVLALLAAARFLPGTVGGEYEKAGDELSAPLPTSLLRNRHLLAALAGTLGGCFGFGMFISFMPVYASSQGLGARQIGIIFASQAAVNTLLRIPLGHISDRIERGVMSAIGLGICAVSLVLIGISSTMWPFTICAGILGIGMGISFTALGAMAVVALPQKQRGVGLGLYNSCIYLGMMASSATMGAVVRQTGFRTAFIVAGGLTLVMTIAFILLYRSACQPLEAGEQPEADISEVTIQDQEEAA